MLSHQRLALLVLASLVCAPASVWAAGDETYDLRGPAIEKGVVIREAGSASMKDGKYKLALIARAGEEAPPVMIEGSVNISFAGDSELTFLAMDGREAMKIETKLIKRSVESKFGVMGQETTNSKKWEIEGATIISEFDKGKKNWKSSLKEGEPTEEQKKELENLGAWTSEDLLVPAEKVKIGHSWENSPALIGKKLLGWKFSNGGGKGRSKFVRLEKVGDEQCALIESEIDVAGRCKDEDDQDLTVSLKGKVLFYRSLRFGVDIKTTYDLQTTIAFTGEKNGQNLEIHFEGKLTGDSKMVFKNR
jgi:hypothetical protein